MTDDGYIDEPDDAPAQPIPVSIGELPGYLFLQSAADKAEARRAFALSFVISADGSLHPNWLATVFTMVQFLEQGALPETAEVRALKPRK
jgi:hypothetical protein